MLKILFIFIFSSLNIFANDYLLEYSKRNDINISKQYDLYVKAYNKAFTSYKNEVLNLWPKFEHSTATKFVEYTNNYSYKKVIDFKKRILKVQILIKNKDDDILSNIFSKNKKDIPKIIVEQYKKLLKYDTNIAFQNNILIKKINQNLDIAQDLPIKNSYLIQDSLNIKQQDDIINTVSLEKFQQTKYKTMYIYKSQINLASDFSLKKARLYKELINKYALKYRLNKNLLFSLIHIQSYFNHIGINQKLQFGLMKVDKNNIALNSYFKLYGKNKLLSNRYLFNKNNNIQLASIYLSKLFNDEFKNIKDEKSKLYFTIVAYNTSIKQAYEVFHKSKSKIQIIKDINTKSKYFIYKQFLRKLPKENSLFLSKVNLKFRHYSKLNL